MADLSKARINGVEYDLKDTTARQSSGGTVDLSGYLKKTELTDAINTALAQAKESGEFDGEPGYTPQKGVDYFDGDDYILTDTDKNEIAEQAAALVEVTDNRCTPQMFDAKGDGVTDDSSALNEWLAHLGDNDVVGYIPNGTYLVNSGITYRPSVSGKRISFVGESSDRTIIKAGFSAGTVIDIRYCYLGEIGNFTIDNNETVVNQDGITGLQLVNMQYTENVFSYIHDINIINVGRRAALILNSDNNNTNGISPDRKSIKYVNMERVNAVSCTPDKTAWVGDAPVGIIVADTAHFHFINCTSRNFKYYPLEFKNYTEYCSHENCVIENCGQGIYLGQQFVADDEVVHKYYKAIGNMVKDVPIGVQASKIAHATFDNNTVISPDCGFRFEYSCEYVTGSGNSYYGDKYAVFFTGTSSCHDNVIETAIYKTAFNPPCGFGSDATSTANCHRCTVIATNYQTTTKTKSVDSDNNAFIPIVNVLSALN